MKKLSLKLLLIFSTVMLYACSAANPDRVVRPSYGGYTAYGECVGCEDARYTTVDRGTYGHNFQRAENSNSAATIAGALIVGGLLFAAIGKADGDSDEDDDRFDDEDSYDDEEEDNYEEEDDLD